MTRESASTSRPRSRSANRGKTAIVLEDGWTRTLSFLRRLGRRRARATLCFALLGLFGSVCVGLLNGPPVPRVHDEFSYLLAGDTFASGRWSNPPHPHWEHFETFHVLQQPTYASKYPPGQGLFLALGQVLFGHPAAGVWLSVGLLTGAITWMLLVWLPPAWALVASLFFTMQVSWVSYWAQSYWGGSVAALGGALALGATRALWTRPRLRHGVLLGLGLGILAASRPFEGGILGLCLAGLLGLGFWKTRGVRRRRLVQLGLLPTIVITGMSLGGLAYYNKQVTGSALQAPYQVYERQYAAAPTFLFKKPGPPRTYTHREFDRFWNQWVRERHQAQSQPVAFLTSGASKALTQFLFFFGPGVLALVALPRVRERRWIGYATVILVSIIVATLFTKQGYPHYAAPAAGAFYIVLGACLMALHRRARSSSRMNLSLAIVIAFIIYIPAMIIYLVNPDHHSFSQSRQSLIRYLDNAPNKHLVLVHYSETHNVLEEWVYNHADIESSPVVWARSMGPHKDANLMAYFSDRTIWILEVDESPKLVAMKDPRVGAGEPEPSSTGEESLP